MCGVGFRIHGLRSKVLFVYSTGFRVQVTVQGSGFRAQGSGFGVQYSGSGVQYSGLRVQGSRFRV